MEQKNVVKIMTGTIGALLVLLLMMIIILPFLNKLLAVEVQQTQAPAVTKIPLPGAPEPVTATVHYQMEEDSKKISDIYIEVYQTGSSTINYLEIPADTKVTLSEELYKSLQTYAPELPQYFKISNMAESFSEAYALTGANRILSELLGISVTNYVRADKKTMEAWFSAQKEGLSDREFFDAYTKWIDHSVSDRITEERWIYYESRKNVQEVQIELAPGSREKDGYLISEKRSGERLKEWMTQKETGQN